MKITITRQAVLAYVARTVLYSAAIWMLLKIQKGLLLSHLLDQVTSQIEEKQEKLRAAGVLPYDAVDKQVWKESTDPIVSGPGRVEFNMQRLMGWN